MNRYHIGQNVDVSIGTPTSTVKTQSNVSTTGKRVSRSPPVLSFRVLRGPAGVQSGSWPLYRKMDLETWWTGSTDPGGRTEETRGGDPDRVIGIQVT